MENCTIYSHQINFERVIEIVKQQLPKASIEHKDGGKQKSLVAVLKGGLFGKKKTLTINYRERANPSYKLDQIECGLTQNLAGMVGFIQNIPAQNPSVQNKFIIKVMAANTEMPFMAEPAITPEFGGILQQIVKELEAFTFAPSSSFFNRSAGQHFLDESLKLILDDRGNSKVADINVKVDAKYHDGPASDYTQEQLDRKSSSESFLENKQIKLNKNLPCLPLSANTQLRTKKEVIERAYALMIIALRGEGVSSEDVKRPIAEKNITAFTAKEQSILQNSILNDQEKTYATWRYESLYTLLWALNVLPDLKYPSEICDVPAVVSAIIKPSIEAFYETCQLKTNDEILEELDKTYRMNWACVDARIKGEIVGGNINPSVVYERHYALNWLTNYQNQAWDDVKTNT